MSIADQPRPLCRQPKPNPVVLPAGLNPMRESAIRLSAKKWVNGTVLHYCFIDRAEPPAWAWVDTQKEVVCWAVNTWKSLGLGLVFTEVTDPSEAEILIGCLQGDGSWSLVGTDNLEADYRNLGRTLNYGWDLTTLWGRATALHEFGHAIGFSHEHQSPKAGIVWNEHAVYQSFSAPPNSWTKGEIDHNIIEKLDAAAVEGSTWDPTSIMEYPFKPGLIIAPKPYDTDGIPENTELSAFDERWAQTWYPAGAGARSIGVMDLQQLNVASGQQRDFEFEPQASRNYTISIVGQADSRVVVFEERDGEPRYLTADDDSGQPTNVALNLKLVQGRKYVVRVRVNFISKPGNVGLLIY